MKYRVHRFSIRMTQDQNKLELFLNSLEGEMVAIIPNVTPFSSDYGGEINLLLSVIKNQFPSIMVLLSIYRG